MKTRYKILIFSIVIITIVFCSITIIDYVYGHQRDFKPMFRLMCPIVTIPDDFEPNRIIFLMYQSDTRIQLDHIWYSIQNTCLTQEDTK